MLRVKESQLILKYTAASEIGCYFTVDAELLVSNTKGMNLSVATVFVSGNKFYIKFLSNNAKDYFETEEFTISNHN